MSVLCLDRNAAGQTWGWILILLAVCFVTATAASAAESGHLYTRGPSESKRLALTFDDGPGPETPRFLALLEREQVNATFFVLGEAVDRQPALVQEMIRHGHEIASHTTTHRNYLQHHRSLAAHNSATAAENQARRDLVLDMQQTDRAIRNACSVPVRLCRMPHGIDRPWIKDAAREMNYALVNWTYGADWQPGSADQLLPGYLRAIQPGAILLFHDGGRNRSKSLQLAEAVIRSAKQQGYEIVTVGQLLGKAPTGWKRDFRVNTQPASPSPVNSLTKARPTAAPPRR